MHHLRFPIPSVCTYASIPLSLVRRAVSRRGVVVKADHADTSVTGISVAHFATLSVAAPPSSRTL